jgi:hypothetical protein
MTYVCLKSHGKKVMDEKSQEKKSQEKSHRKKSHIYNVIFQIIKVVCKSYFKISFIIVFLTIKNDLCMSVYKHYDNSNQVASFYKLPLSI